MISRVILFRPVALSETVLAGSRAERTDSIVVSAQAEVQLLSLVRKYAAACAVVVWGDWVRQEILRLAEEVRRIDEDCPFLMISATGVCEMDAGSRRDDLLEFLERNALSEEILARVSSLAPVAEQMRIRKSVGPDLVGANCLVGSGPGLSRVRTKIAKIAATNANVLITGESGTGKELAAELIHKNSAHRDRQFVTVNCAAVPETLLESELFGHMRGAFTGASATRIGKLEFASGGTLFLDEIGDMSPAAQAKILRAVESRVIQRVGSNVDTPIDVRLIAATNQDLELMMRDKKFRPDLYFRLNAVRLHLPPLRERREDIPELVDYILKDLASRHATTLRQMEDEVIRRFQAHDWPGNIRELRNVLESVLVFSSSSRIELRHIPTEILQTLRKCALTSADERGRILTALASAGWNRNRAAQILHCSRMTLYRRMVRLSIRSEPHWLHDEAV